MFLTSYVVDAPPGTNRPVTFAFNGGPGSSSVWLHLGLLGPRRVDSGDAGALTPPPYGLLDNPQSLLAVSDLVFIDPVSTGFSRAVEGGKAKDYHGFKADIESVGELIRLWTTRHNRWLSPKYIAGESYGTIRAAALADHLQTQHGLYPNGILLISSVLDLATVDFEFRNDRAHVDYLPTYAATAHYHGKHGRKSLRKVLDEAEEYAARDYPWALSRGSRLTARGAGRARRQAGRPHRPLGGLRRPLRPADRAHPLLHRAAARPGPGRRPARQPLHRPARQRRRGDVGRRPVDGRDQRALRRRLEPLRARRAGLPQRPAVHADLDEGQRGVVVQGVRGQADRRLSAAVASDAGQPAPARARGLRLPRRRHAVLRRGGRRRPPEHPGVAARQHRARLLRGRAHDVRARADQAPAEQGPGRLRHRRQQAA